MLPAMATWKLAFAIALLSLAGCGSRRGDTEAPALPAPATVDDSSEGDAPARSEPAAESEAADTETASAPAPARKACSGLAKSACQVAEGCAWSTDKKCVDQ
jgi:hypothetical protein